MLQTPYIPHWQGKATAFNPFGAMALFSLGYIPNNESLSAGVEVPMWDIPRAKEDVDPSPKAATAFLREEMAKIDFGIKPIVVLVSGGLDSRLTLALLAEVVSTDRLTAVIWGVKNCRDMVIAQEIVDAMGITKTLLYEVNGSHVFDYAKYAVSLSHGESNIFYMGPLIAQSAELKDTGAENIVTGFYGNFFRKSYPINCLPSIHVDDKLNLFDKDFALEQNEHLSKWNSAACESEGIANNIWFQTYKRRGVSYHLLPFVDSGYKVFTPFGLPRVISYIKGIAGNIRSRQWEAQILHEINPELCHIPDQKDGKAFIGNREIDKMIPRHFMDSREWLHERCREWAIPHYKNADAFKAFGIDPAKIENMAGEFFSNPLSKYDIKWKVLLFSLNLSIFYALR